MTVSAALTTLGLFFLPTGPTVSLLTDAEGSRTFGGVTCGGIQDAEWTCAGTGCVLVPDVILDVGQGFKIIDDNCTFVAGGELFNCGATHEAVANNCAG